MEAIFERRRPPQVTPTSSDKPHQHHPFNRAFPPRAFGKALQFSTTNQPISHLSLYLDFNVRETTSSPHQNLIIMLFNNFNLILVTLFFSFTNACLILNGKYTADGKVVVNLFDNDRWVCTWSGVCPLPPSCSPIPSLHFFPRPALCFARSQPPT